MTSGSHQLGRRPIVRFAPEEWGYGPLGIALHIAHVIRSVAAETIRLEIVLSDTFRSPVDDGLFDRIHSDVASAEMADAVVTVMNVKGIMTAARRNERVYAVDALAWLWDEPLPIQDMIHTYFYQDLPVLPVPSRNFAQMPNATPIPAIGHLPDCDPNSGKGATTSGSQLVLSLSGLETPGSRLGTDSLWYPSYILNALDHLVKMEHLDPANLALFGNAAVIGHFAGPRIAHAVRQRSSQYEFSLAARSAGAVVCSPGLTTIIECLRAGIGLKLLPAQNYGQLRQMTAFVDAIGIPAMPWAGVTVQWLQNATLPSHVRSAIMRGIIAEERLARDYADPEALLSMLIQDPPIPNPETVESLIGPDTGALIVANCIVSDLSG